MAPICVFETANRSYLTLQCAPRSRYGYRLGSIAKDRGEENELQWPASYQSKKGSMMALEVQKLVILGSVSCDYGSRSVG